MGEEGFVSLGPGDGHMVVIDALERDSEQESNCRSKSDPEAGRCESHCR